MGGVELQAGDKGVEVGLGRALGPSARGSARDTVRAGKGPASLQVEFRHKARARRPSQDPSSLLFLLARFPVLKDPKLSVRTIVPTPQNPGAWRLKEIADPLLRLSLSRDQGREPGPLAPHYWFVLPECTWQLVSGAHPVLTHSPSHTQGNPSSRNGSFTDGYLGI